MNCRCRITVGFWFTKNVFFLAAAIIKIWKLNKILCSFTGPVLLWNKNVYYYVYTTFDSYYYYLIDESIIAFILYVFFFFVHPPTQRKSYRYYSTSSEFKRWIYNDSGEKKVWKNNIYYVYYSLFVSFVVYDGQPTTYTHDFVVFVYILDLYSTIIVY